MRSLPYDQPMNKACSPPRRTSAHHPDNSHAVSDAPLLASGAAEVDLPRCVGRIGVVRVVVRNGLKPCLRTAVVRRSANCSS